jgi:hypothetical protein
MFALADSFFCPRFLLLIVKFELSFCLKIYFITTVLQDFFEFFGHVPRRVVLLLFHIQTQKISNKF